MKVILLAPLPPPSGGIAGWTQRMLSANLKNGWTVGVVDEKLVGERNVKGGGHRKSLFTEVKRSKRIWKELKNQLRNPDAKVVQACVPATTGALLREIVSARITHKRGRKFVTHFRCTVPNMVKTRIQIFLLKKLVKHSDCVFCLNRQTFDFIQSYGIGVECRIIPNFIDASETYHRTDYSTEINKVIYTGRVLESKGCALLFELAKHEPEITFELIGKVLMDTPNLPSNIILTGEQDRSFIRDELKTADVFMFLTNFPGEGFSNSLAEAMAFSLPCIVTDWAANADMIGEGGGVVCKNRTVEDALNALNIIKSELIRRKMGERNYQKVLTVYNLECVTGLYIDAYEKIINE